MSAFTTSKRIYWKIFIILLCWLFFLEFRYSKWNVKERLCACLWIKSIWNNINAVCEYLFVIFFLTLKPFLCHFPFSHFVSSVALLSLSLSFTISHSFYSAFLFVLAPTQSFRYRRSNLSPGHRTIHSFILVVFVFYFFISHFSLSSFQYICIFSVCNAKR